MEIKQTDNNGAKSLTWSKKILGIILINCCRKCEGQTKHSTFNFENWVDEHVMSLLRWNDFMLVSL